MMKRILRDGIDYEFTPGKNGSLVSRSSTKQTPFNFTQPKKKSKVIGSLNNQNKQLFALKKRGRSEVYDYE